MKLGTKVCIREATPSDLPAWDAYVLAHPEGTAYHLCAWVRCVESAYGFRSRGILAEDEGVRGVLPIVEMKIPLLGRKLVTLPYCDVGGPLADTAGIAAQLLQAALNRARELGAKAVEVRSAAPLDGEAPSAEKVRMLLDLPGSAEGLMASFPSKLRSQVRKPERDGLTVSLGGGDLVSEFYEIFAENMRDLGSPVHSKRWIRAVVEEFGDRARVGVVHLSNGEPAAGGVVLCHDRVVSIPWASSLRRHNRLNPNMALYWAFLKFAAEGGFARFDFGRSTPGEGTYRFKEQWGATPVALYWKTLGLGGELVRNVSASPGKLRAVAESAIRMLPVAGATWLGPRVRRYISL